MYDDREQSFVSRMSEVLKMPEENIRREIKEIVHECNSEDRARNARFRLLDVHE